MNSSAACESKDGVVPCGQDDEQRAFLLKTGCWVCPPPVTLVGKHLRINQVDQRNFSSCYARSIVSGQPCSWPGSEGQAHPGVGRHRATEDPWGWLALQRDLEQPSQQLCGLWSCRPRCRCEYEHQAVPLAMSASSPGEDLVERHLSMLRMTHQAPFFF